MAPAQYNPSLANSTLVSQKSTAKVDERRYTSPQIVDQALRAHSEHSSENSSDSSTFFANRNMNRGQSGSLRGSQGSYRGGRGGDRPPSTSSGGSSERYTSTRPIIKPPFASPSRSTPSNTSYRAATQVESPTTPTKQQSSFTLHGNQINETYTARPNTFPSPPKYFTPSSPSPTRGRGRSFNGPRGQRTTPRPVARHEAQHWAHQQEEKIRISRVPKSLWTKDIYKALSSYGSVFRIDMQSGTLENDAYVTFRPPPHKPLLQQQIRVGGALVRWEPLSPHVTMIPSPANPAKNYPEFTILHANSIDFGVRDTDKSIIAMRTVESHSKILITLNLGRKELDIQFPVTTSSRVRKYRFRLPIPLLSHIYQVIEDDTGNPTLIIPFDHSPQFFMRMTENETLGNGRKHTSFSANDKIWNDWDAWYRITDVTDDVTMKKLKDMPLMNHKDTSFIDIGRWTSYRLSFDEATISGVKYTEFRNALADHGVVIEDLDRYSMKSGIAPPLWTLLQEEISGTHPHLDPTPNDSVYEDLFPSQIHLSYPIRYQLEACLSNGYLKEHSITSNFLEKLRSMDHGEAVYILEKVVDKQHIYYDPMEIFNIRIKGSLEKKVPNYCVLQRSVIITPSMMHVASPVMETSNRIVRKYAADADRFIRVKFSDEKTEGTLRNLSGDRAFFAFDRIRRAMEHGIVVAGRHYEFLAFGNSQFREHGAYFYSRTSTKSANDIRLTLGNFDHIKTVAKYGARLGQCFSTTRAMRVSVKIVKILDIERNGFNFTDGVGKISLFLAQMAAQELGLSNAFDDPPSLYQFRLGGCKGVLALDPKIIGSEVHMRPSQQKFEAEFTGLEIIRSSALATPFFNRQIIIVLSNLGVPDHVFIQKQQGMVDDYAQAMTDEKIAIQKLRQHIDMNQTTLTMAGMVLDGFMKAKDPFIMSLLRLWRACTIKNLKEKARIAVDDGAFVLGCVDETATLKGHMDDPQSRLDATRDEKLSTLPEIFLQVDDTKKKGHYKIVEGICILARNPSLHPGDLRVVHAVDVPALRHLKNVVVFPQSGDRDLPNMCSGGDLDGDDYMVLWDKDLLPRDINLPPMDFTPEKPIEKSDPITVADIGDFFVTYMKNNSLGQIAHAHLAQADYNTEGISSSTCLELAKLHSQAVDYPKSGIPAVMTRDLRPWKWPHFMEKKHVAENRIYRSKKVLGRLYDQIQLIKFEPYWENGFDERILKAFEPTLTDGLLKEAAKVKASYDESLRRLMAKHGIHTEFEAWSVFVLEHNHESRDYKFAEEFGRTIEALKAQYKATCRDKVNPADWNQLGPFVAAMYIVTAQETERALEECRTMKTVGGERVPLRTAEHMPLISFPWLFPSELGKIALGTRNVRQLEPAQPPQGLPHRHKKDRAAADSEPGVVETEGEVTHYGELLNLDFGPILEAKKVAEDEQDTPPVVESYEWKRDQRGGRN